MPWEFQPPESDQTESKESTSAGIDASDYWRSGDSTRTTTTTTSDSPVSSGLFLTGNDGGVGQVTMGADLQRATTSAYGLESQYGRSFGPGPQDRSTPLPGSYDAYRSNRFGNQPQDSFDFRQYQRVQDSQQSPYYSGQDAYRVYSSQFPGQFPPGQNYDQDRRMPGPDAAVAPSNPMSYRAMFGNQGARVGQPGPMFVADNGPQQNGPQQQDGERRGILGGKPLFNPPAIAERTDGKGGLLRNLLRGKEGRDAHRGKDKVPDAKLETHKFDGPNEYGVVGEIAVPSNLKLDPTSDDWRKTYEDKATETSVTIFDGVGLPPEGTKALEDLVTKHSGVLKENSPEWETAVYMMGGGYHSFSNKPSVSVETVSGRKVLVLSDETQQHDKKAYTMFVPSDKFQYLYPVSFEGDAKQFNGVKKGLDTIKWRVTPDALPQKPEK